MAHIRLLRTSSVEAELSAVYFHRYVSKMPCVGTIVGRWRQEAIGGLRASWSFQSGGSC